MPPARTYARNFDASHPWGTPHALPELRVSDAPPERVGHSTFPIVGVGASAGGFEAFRELLGHLPDSTGMAFLYVQHLDPHHESRLSELLARATRMQVVEAAHDLPVEIDHVYVIPPNTNMTIAKGVLRLTPRGESRAPHLAVDHLLRSLAEDQQTRAIGVVLSGTGSDGTIGLSAIKSVGGITFAQEPDSARQAGMPKSAIDSGCVDFVAPVEAIARRLVEVSRHPYQRPQSEEPQPQDEDQLEAMLRIVQHRTGVDFREYRDSTIRRRVLRRMALHGHRSHADYLRLLAANRNEIDALYQDLLINVTQFFRDPELFDLLKRSVFPEIARGKSAGAPIRIWVPGCSTGQEPYSLAMALWEFLDAEALRPSVQIFATDLSDPVSLDRARAGIYPESIEAEVSPERLRRFFTHEDHTYRICKEIRDACIFARQNMTSDPPFSHVQLISCRNALIYMSVSLQKRVLPTFHYALDAPGFLVLGSAESVGPFTDLFDVVDRDHKVFLKKPTATRLLPLFARNERGGFDSDAGLRAPTPAAAEASFQREADRLLLTRYSPAGVLIDENFDVLQFRGHTSPYLEAPPGEPTTNLLRMARGGLLPGLRDALLEAKTRGASARRERLNVRGEEKVREIDLLVVPVRPADAPAGCLLVLFEEPPHAAPRARRAALWRRLAGWFRGGNRPRGAGPTDERRSPSAELSDPFALRQELSATKEFLQTLLERQNAANEDLRSANEEILSSNEELQSTNEELETAKEELQSTNEELTTVNEQLNSRNAELNLLNNDLINLQDSTTIPIVVLDSELRIRRFTPPAKRILNLLPSDLGRPISDLAAAIAITDLEQLVSQVIESVRSIERQVQDADGRWHELRIHPYRTAENRIEGAVLVLIDIDAAKRAEVAIRDARDYADAIVETVREPLLVLDAKLRVRRANRSFYQTFQVAAAETEMQPLFEVGARQWDIPELRSLLEGVLPGRRAIHDFEVTLTFPKIGVRTLRLNARPILSDGKPDLILLSLEDLTSQRAEEALRSADRRKDEFLAILSHELRNPLGAMLNSVELLKRVGGLPEPAEHARDLLERPLRLMTRLVDDLLDVTRITENKIELRKQRISLATSIEAAVDNTRVQVGEHGPDLRTVLPAEPLWVEADPVRLTQMISNLLSNAVHYTPAGGEVRITCERDAAARQIVISVRDNGIGIAEDQIEPIFEMFNQGSAPVGSKLGGLGLGLALTRKLAELQGGSIEARSAGVGQGSEFIIRLPEAERAWEPALVRHARRQQVAGPAHRILVVDDDRDQAESLALLLEKLGHEVRLAHDGASAVTAALEFVPDVAVVDIGLPDIDGYEVARRLRHQPALRETRLIAQTGWGDAEHRRRSAEAGFEQHLVKPVEIDDLQRLLRLSRTG